MIDFGRFEALTFDCYGTLIDWESGLTGALTALLGEGVQKESDETLLESFGRFESEAERGDYKSYRQVLTEVARRFAEERELELSASSIEAFASSVSDWPPFADTVDALKALSKRYELCIVSNVDDDLFAGSARQLGVEFAQVVTAQQVRSYKPDPSHFQEVLSRLELPKERVLHVAQSLYHDIAPARAIGMTCVWVNRRAGAAGGGATPPSGAIPDHEVPDMASLVRAIGL